MLPPDATKLGFVSFDDPEAALWRPFGSRRIFHITPRDSTVDLQHSEIRYVLINSQTFKNYFPQPLDAWLEQMDAEMVRQISLELRGSAPPIEWLLIRRRDPTVAPAVTPKL